MATTNSQRIDLDALPEYTALKVEIEISGLHQYTIAERVGLSEGQLSRVLAGRRPLTPDLASRIRAAIAEGVAA